MKSSIFSKKIRILSLLSEFKIRDALNRFEFNIKVGNGINLECYGFNPKTTKERHFNNGNVCVTCVCYKAI